MKQHIAFIINKTTKFAHRFSEEIAKQSFDSAKFELSFLYSQYSGHAIELSKQAIQNGANCVVAVGGNGTCNEVAQAVAFSNCTLGIIPTSDGNDFANYIGLKKKSISEYLTIIKKGQTTNVDVGKVESANNSRYFLGYFSTGFTPHIANRVKGIQKKSYNTYFKDIFKLLKSYKKKLISVEVNYFKEEVYPFELFIGNLDTLGKRTRFNYFSSIQDNTFEIMLIEKMKYLRFAIFLLFSFFRLENNVFDIAHHFKSEKIRLYFFENTPCHVDMELLELEGSVTITSYSKAIKVIIADGKNFL